MKPRLTQSVKMCPKGCFQNEFTISPHIYRIRVPTNGPQLAMDVNMKPRLTQSVKMCPKWVHYYPSYISNKGTNERSPTCHGRQHETKIDTKCQNVSKMRLYKNINFRIFGNMHVFTQGLTLRNESFLRSPGRDLGNEFLSIIELILPVKMYHFLHKLGLFFLKKGVKMCPKWEIWSVFFTKKVSKCVQKWEIWSGFRGPLLPPSPNLPSAAAAAHFCRRFTMSPFDISGRFSSKFEVLFSEKSVKMCPKWVEFYPHL